MELFLIAIHCGIEEQHSYLYKLGEGRTTPDDFCAPLSYNIQQVILFNFKILLDFTITADVFFFYIII